MAARQSLGERVLDTLNRADPLERLRALVEVQESMAELRAAAMAELLEAGWPPHAVAVDLGVSHQRVYGWR